MARSAKQWGEDFESNPTRTGRRLIFGLIGFGLLIGVVMWVIHLFSIPAKVVDKVLDPNNIIQNYEWFKQQYQDYNAINVKCNDADTSVARFMRTMGPRDKWDFSDKEELARLQTISDGLKYQRADIVAKYNARSQMASRDIFKTGELPAQLPQ